MSENNKTILKWTGIVTVLLVVSRLLGFVRESAITFRFGATLETDAYYLVMVLPQVLFLAFNDAIKTAFIPVYGEYHKREDGATLAATAFVILAVSLIIVTAGLILFAPWVVRLVAPGFEGEKFQIAVELARVILPSLIFMGLGGWCSGILHTKRNFVIPAIPAYSSNLIIIFTALLFGLQFGIMGLAWGTVVGFASQFLVQLPAVAKHNVFKDWKLDWRHPGLKKMAVVLPPVLLGGAAIEIKTLVDRMFGSLLPDGSITWLAVANRIYLLPNGILILALLTVLYPTLVELNVEKKMAEFKKTFREGVGLIVVLMLPMMVGLVILRVPVVRLLFERGEFGAVDTAATAYPLALYSISLMPLGIMLLIKRTFFALLDTKTPMYFMIFTEALNILLNYLLIGPLGHGGIALGTSLAVYVGAGGMAYLLWRKIGMLGGRRIFDTFVKSAVAAGIMGLVVFWGQRFLTGGGFVRQAMELGALIGFGAALYFALAYALKVRELDVALEMVRRRLKR
ncbi:murein biosynthesis integral membrane protein MurJ [Dethiobacter alkaliphilus]|uniref:murein biosynthesis integral membrane protein MurJ n=1 Tax=Dethiobacter alkaliphilus TaxID=427926 RepID=UPI002226D27F|nr:murein biosynthesis integral membrane protein MurJ [Dethiobacter alkaliphilus]MCW3488793.1 murein biosynthesis integral membrane protein MurJ [Dethiobacter alkaliphilus]